MTIRTRLRRLEASARGRRPAPPPASETPPLAAYVDFAAAIPAAGPIPQDLPHGVDPRLRELWPYAGVIRTMSQAEDEARATGNLPRLDELHWRI
jgi:hypothetical protein